MNPYNFATHYKCINCSKEHPLSNDIYVCPECNGNLDILYNYRMISKKLSKKILEKRKEPSLFRYHELYPVSGDIEKFNKLRIGFTPLYEPGRLKKILGYNNFYIKDDTSNPSASFKDRASIMAIMNASQNGHEMMVAASTGNAASSLACLSASLGMKNIIVVPRSAPRAKISQLVMFGANLVMVKGTYDDAFDLSVAITKKYGLYNRNTGFNPFTREGKKSVSFEIAEQMNWQVPDYVFVPVGDGNIISGVWKGFRDLFEIGLIKTLPGVVAVQSDKSSAVADAFLEERNIEPVKATTIADSISVNRPKDGEAALRSVIDSKGFAIKVSDEEILDYQKKLAQHRGIFAEPSGAASLAGLARALKKKMIDAGKKSVILVTGSGLKDIDAVMKGMKEPVIIRPDITDFDKIKEKIITF
ncbi:MAG: threonine synthase [Spirochaetes bacterium]|nr:threonine synthase [Spirochaetota bacterium]